MTVIACTSANVQKYSERQLCHERKMGLLNPLCGSTELRRDMDGDALVVVNNDYNRHRAMPQVPFCVAKPPVLQPKAACFAS